MKPDDIDLQLQHGTHGWDYARLSVNRTVHEFTLTGIFNDPLEGLAESAVRLDAGDATATFTWYEEPGRFDFTFTRIPTAQHLDRVTIVDSDRVNVAPIEFTVKRAFWLKLVRAELSKIMLLATDEHYAKNRTVKELPWDAIQALCGKISP
ncbi:hypothetical protein [Armatimonas rosea]|uniref:Uncharacterized protein n=1 Tax=Armatimonas rosea TaxID=685828 RepID=A0A7W9STK2_ARMRO|nr:hypothetical protein [Armatimonas rosea]MBB6052595.1 hypothetical protein [Armatimonas rosea]